MNNYTPKNDLADQVDRHRDIGVPAPGMEALILAVAELRDAVLSVGEDLETRGDGIQGELEELVVALAGAGDVGKDATLVDLVAAVHNQAHVAQDLEEQREARHQESLQVLESYMDRVFGSPDDGPEEPPRPPVELLGSEGAAVLELDVQGADPERYAPGVLTAPQEDRIRLAMELRALRVSIAGVGSRLPDEWRGDFVHVGNALYGWLWSRIGQLDDSLGGGR